MKADLLEEIGLTKSEVKVYLALLDLGSSTTGKIVDKSKASSSKIYEILDKLIQKGLVSFIIKSGVKHFEAASPERILDYMKEKEDKIHQQSKDLKELIPELELKQKLSRYKSEATIFKGVEGAKTAFDDILKTMKKGDTYHVLGAMGKDTPFFGFIKQYHIRRSKKGIKLQILYGAEGKAWSEEIKHLPHTEIKFAPSQFFSTASILMYANKTLITVGQTKDITLFRIESKEVTESFRTQFKLLWNQDTLTYKGDEEVKTAFRNLVSELKKGEEVHIMGVYDFGKEFLPLALYFQKIRSEKGIKAKFLMNREAKHIAEKFKNYPPVEIKFMDKELSTPGIFLIYKDKVIINLAKEKTFFVIKSKSSAQAFESYFQYLWNQEVRVLRGLDAVQEKFEEMLEAGHGDLIGARGYFVDYRPKVIESWEKRAIESGFTMRNIVDSEVKGHRITRFKFVKTKYTLPKEFSVLSVFWIYGGKVVIINWTKKEPLLFEINNPLIYEVYKKQFEVLWNK